MHIPDGYLSPQTYVPLYALTASVLAVAARKTRRSLRSRHVPLLALGAAFSFVIMMFNIPIPGGTSGHAVGAPLVAILLGPWGACISVSIALVIQALLFGDGGITALGANCFTMAVVMPFVASCSYRLLAGSAPPTARRRRLAGGVAGYLAINAAALYTAILFGLQPLLATGADGRPLYAPYPLAVAVPAMAVQHLLLFGFVEGVVTALVIGYLQRTDPALLTVSHGEDHRPTTLRRLWSGIALLAILSPLGVVFPAAFGAGGAWGEWSAGELGRMLGYLPAGMGGIAGIWRAPLAGYSLPGGEGLGLPVQGVVYALSALLGIGAILLLFRFGRKLLAARELK